MPAWRRVLTCVLLFLGIVSAGACYEVKIDTLQRWCEHVSGTDLTEKYAPAWALLPSVSFHYDEIRQSYVGLLDSLALARVKGRAPRMVWQTGTTLNVASPSDLLVIAPESVLADWRAGLARGVSGRTTDEGDECVFGTAASLFDTVAVHFGVQDVAGRFVGDTVVAVPTGRKQRL
jgi:hypothetical protein